MGQKRCKFTWKFF